MNRCSILCFRQPHIEHTFIDLLMLHHLHLLQLLTNLMVLTVLRDKKQWYHFLDWLVTLQMRLPVGVLLLKLLLNWMLSPYHALENAHMMLCLMMLYLTTPYLMRPTPSLITFLLQTSHPLSYCLIILARGQTKSGELIGHTMVLGHTLLHLTKNQPGCSNGRHAGPDWKAHRCFWEVYDNTGR